MIEIIVTVAIILGFWLFLFLLLDFYKPRVIRYRPVGEKYWRIAFNEEDMRQELEGRMADIIMPDKPYVKRMFCRRRFIK